MGYKIFNLSNTNSWSEESTYQSYSTSILCEQNGNIMIKFGNENAVIWPSVQFLEL